MYSRYDAFGNTISQTSDISNKYGFAGEQFDSDLGDYYLRQRSYNPRSGRFGRRDTYEGRLTDSLTLHRYIYAHANPTNLTDPTGLSALTMGDLTAVFALVTIFAASSYLITVRDYQPEPLGEFGEGNRPRTVLDAILAWKNTWKPEPLGGFNGQPAPNMAQHTGHSTDAVDLAQFVFSASFQGPAAKGFDWTHIYDRHSAWGKTAQQSGKKDVFWALTSEKQIQRAVKNAWKNREKIETQDNLITNERRMLYQGLDPETGYVIEMWFSQETKMVETAYPVRRD
ncbi:RHS repeat-associated core domain-containing protein [Leptolyngbya sp. GGD]|uniref:RHS repeat-associated core domain-containing protein n=1 Tax=Leptolyngbya sp. GGD TaxID=2997907 RepID=UPI00227BD292|nr:RHS repeat-associated core domain-containing protein [Leptolyngbya sp. GGD]MCY6493943.1 RHS repeat-associated core domain-containing protein [Leptolyngbya sp. GGD]